MIASVPLATPIAVRHADVGGELLLEGRDLGAEDVAPGVQHRHRAVVEAPAQRLERGERYRKGGPAPRERYPSPSPRCSSQRPSPTRWSRSRPTSSRTWGCPGCSCSCSSRARASRSPPRRRCCSRASTCTRASTACSRSPLWARSANLGGSWLAYAVGYYGRIDLIEKHGHQLFIKPKHIEWADRWFARYGAPTVFFSRMLPIVRTFISLPAGRGADAVLAVHGLHAARLHPVGVPARLHRPGGGRELDEMEGRAPLRRLRGGGADRRRDRLPRAAQPLAARQGRGRRRCLGRSARLDVIEPSRSARSTGPAELLPISSSGHVALVPWLLGWPYARLDPELRKAFEVALHAGTAAALVVALRDEVADGRCGLDGRRGALILLSSLPPAACALLLERPIERRLGTPATIAAGLLLGSAAMVIADGAPQERGREEAGPRDALCARDRPGHRADARRVAQRRDARGRPAAPLPSRGRQRALAPRRASGHRAARRALKGKRLARRGLPPGAGIAFAAGVAASFASTLASHLADPPGRARPLAAALRRVPHGARGRGAASCAVRQNRASMTRTPTRAPAWTPATPPTALAGLVGVLRTIDPGRPSRSVLALRPLRERDRGRPEPRASRCAPTASARR